MTPLDIGRLRRALAGRRIEYYRSIDSTMIAAARLERGAVVLAEEQTAGQGRLGRKWHSESGAGIYCSMVLDPAPALTLALALAARVAIRKAAGITCDIRWPNDLLVDGKKVAGILVQVSGDQAVAGIGVNVNQSEFPAELADEATSLLLARPAASRIGGEFVSREDILLALIPEAEAHAQLDRETVLSLFSAASSFVQGKRVKVFQPGGTIEGVTAGLDPSGFLRLRAGDGSETLVLAGGVRAAGA